MFVQLPYKVLHIIEFLEKNEEITSQISESLIKKSTICADVKRL